MVKTALTTAKAGLLKEASSLLKFLGKTMGKQALMRIGALAGEKAARIAAQQLAAKAAARAAAQASAKVAHAAATAATTGPAAPLVFVAEMAFAALSIGLDLGDAGGYLKMTTNNMYVDMKKDFDGEFNKVLKELKDSNITDKDLPILIGPLSQLANMTEKDYSAFLDQGYGELFKNNDPLIHPMINKINEDIKNNVIDYESLNDPNIYEYYLQFLDHTKIHQKLHDNFCIINNGKIILRNGINQCTYKDKSSCENSYKWPLEQNEEDEFPKNPYAEFKSNLLNGVCILANPSLRSLCENNKLNYNTDDGLCRVTKEYCLTKGSDWKNDDCHISKGQDIAEMIFGTTIVRGLIQAFDPKQYEPCLKDETDDGYFCRSISCKDGDEQWDNGGICYPKCKEGYKPAGCCICQEKCPVVGYNEHPAGCTPKTHGVPAATTRDVCPSGTYKSTAGLCRVNCPSGTNDVLGVCYSPCPSGHTEVGVLCREPCREGYSDTLGVCWADSCPSGYSKSVPGFCMKHCPSGYTNKLGVCWADNCPSGYSTSVPGFCMKHCPSGYTNKAGVCWADSCPSGFSTSTVGMCMRHCAHGYNNNAGVCWEDTYGRGGGRTPDKAPCASGQRDDGTSCWEDWKCNTWDDGYYNYTWGGANTKCWDGKRTWGRNDCYRTWITKLKTSCDGCGCIKATAMDRYRCNDNEVLRGALCYPKCRDGYYESTVNICTFNGGHGKSYVPESIKLPSQIPESIKLPSQVPESIKLPSYTPNTNPKSSFVTGIKEASCPSNKQDFLALCYNKCEEGYTMKSSGICKFNGSEITKKTYGRGAGYPAVKIRAKKRIIPFSTKDN